MRGNVSEAPHLSVLVGEREEGVEADEDQGVAALDIDVGEVAHRHRNPVTAGLLAELQNHRLGHVDPVHLEPALDQRQREPPGADRQLQHGPAGGELGECFHRAFGV